MVLNFNQHMINEAAIKSLSRVWQHTKNSNIGIITAFRGELKLEDNRKRNKQLSALIRQNGFGYFTVIGFYTENLGSEEEEKVQEESFVVISSANDAGKLKNFLMKMGEKYNQDSILYKAASEDDAILIGTAGGRWPGKGSIVKAGKWSPQKMGTYYTKMKGNRTFVFESVELPEGLMSRAYREKQSK